MKCNRSEIMKRAWEIKKSYRARSLTFGQCLSRAWDEAKREVGENAYNGVDFVNGMEITMNDVTRTLNRWTKNGMDRVYINYGKKNDGYIDLVSRKIVGGNKYEYLAKIAAAVLSMNF